MRRSAYIRALIAALRQVKTPVVNDARDDRPNLRPDEQIAAALDWWREAGVDCDFANEPVNWLVRHDQAREQEPQTNGEPAAVRPSPAQVAAPAVDIAGLPPSLDAFVQWWLSEPSLDQGRTTGRVPPRGPVGADLMVLVPHPEREDEDRLLSGPHGRLLDAMLAAMGVAPDAAYVASVLPRHMPHADWQAIAASGMGRIVGHHVRIAAPRRLIVFGRNILPLLGHDPANNPGDPPNFNHDRASVPVMPARDLGVLIGRPRWKAGFWRDWLSWVG